MGFRNGLIAGLMLMVAHCVALAEEVSFDIVGDGRRCEDQKELQGTGDVRWLFVSRDANPVFLVSASSDCDINNAKLYNEKGKDVSSASLDKGDGHTGKLKGLEANNWYKLIYGNNGNAASYIKYVEHKTVGNVSFVAQGGELRLEFSNYINYYDASGKMRSVKRIVGLEYADYVENADGTIGDSVRRMGITADSFIVINKPLAQTRFMVTETIGGKTDTAYSRIYSAGLDSLVVSEKCNKTAKIENPIRNDGCSLFLSADASPEMEVVLADKKLVKSVEVRKLMDKKANEWAKVDTAMGENGWPQIKGIERDRIYEISYGGENCGEKGRCKRYFNVVSVLKMESIMLDTISRMSKDTTKSNLAKLDSALCKEIPYIILPEIKYLPLTCDTMCVLPRKVEVKYDTYNYSDGEWSVESRDTTIDDKGSEFYVPSPIIRTAYMFTHTVGEYADTIVSDTIDAIAVEVHPMMRIQEKVEHNREDEHSENEIYFSKSGGEKQGTYSAPLLMDLYANASSRDLTFEWHFAKTNDFKGSRITYLENVLSYSYSKKGDTYIMLKAISPTTGCVASESIGIGLLGSQLGIPNVFTPNGDGQNDEFRVSYSSIEKFHIRIYSSFGMKVYESDDITKGWDGTYKGNKLANGAYYYVIEAEGTDGEEYKEKGTVNLFREAE